MYTQHMHAHMHTHIKLLYQEFIRIEGKEGELWPIVTVGQHAACCLGFNTEHPQLLVTGGRSNQDTAMEGTWLFDVANKRWNEVMMYTSLTRLSLSLRILMK